ncbi:hypothetical protein PIROE2DRAFT_1755 [Piromyces sp. E2]|nr:hypothetical protein PIROE2DRAFT_1755 [Piromyces sp. E2]|eukprot:OUM70078.1 hypothetical protein PIROE2DRAFT_1755 [Piromyces sp. E2]
MSKDYQLNKKKSAKGQRKARKRISFESFRRQPKDYDYLGSPEDDENYNPNLPIPKEHRRFFLSFYEMFIDPSGLAVVSLPDRITKTIKKEIQSQPTVGVFDHAAKYIVEIMYHTLYPTLMNQKSSDLEYLV